MAHMFNDAACALYIIAGTEESSKFWGLISQIFYGKKLNPMEDS